MYKSGFITIIGRPNVGKSTFMNALLNKKISIMSDKAQTTRNTIQGVLTTPDYQMVFIDTPGIHKPKHQLGEFMNTIALKALKEVDVVLFMSACDEKIGKGDLFMIEALKKMNRDIYLVLNKTDKVTKEVVLEQITAWSALFPFKHIIPLSAKDKDNLEIVKTLILEELEEGPMYFPEDQITNYPEKFIIAEFIREKVLYLTSDEIPHSVAVVIEKIAFNDEMKTLDVHAAIIVERKSQKGIVVGKQGAMIKKIRQLAQRDIKRLLGTAVYLELYVKDEKDWRNKPKFLNEFGYNADEY